MCKLKRKVKQYIKEYLKTLNENNLLLENFNEKSLQHNLGEFIKQKLNHKYIIQYERNLSYFVSLQKYVHNLNKEEIDILILKKDTPKNIHTSAKPKCIIEIKFLKSFTQSLSKQTENLTQWMQECLLDLEFIEQCEYNDIPAISLILSDDSRIYSKSKSGKAGRKRKYINLWDAFQNGITLSSNVIQQINGKINKSFQITKSPSLKWKELISYKDEEGHDLILKYIIN